MSDKLPVCIDKREDDFLFLSSTTLIIHGEFVSIIFWSVNFGEFKQKFPSRYSIITAKTTVLDQITQDCQRKFTRYSFIYFYLKKTTVNFEIPLKNVRKKQL